MKVDKFKFHLLLQDKIIPELEKMINEEDYILEVKRLGKYELTRSPIRDFHIGTYIDKHGKIWYLTRV